jgi:hypothetical protein
MNLLSQVCFWYLMNINGCNFLLMSVVIWIKGMGGWMICCHKSFTRKKKERKKSTKKGKKKNDLICEQYTNVCKLGVSWNRQGFKNHVD